MYGQCGFSFFFLRSSCSLASLVFGASQIKVDIVERLGPACISLSSFSNVELYHSTRI